MEAHSNDETIHVHNSFTELFHILKQPKLSDVENDFSAGEISLMMVHADNALMGLLHGLQAIGSAVASASFEHKDDIIYIGHFLTLIANLMEALNLLRGDCEYRLFECERQLLEGHV
ncbi:MAG TPA: hypothetical protein VFF04_03640 [Candidatus Babeliales bacterium]|nr:hypothetical protein [Candidatus Babeliales bacterium]